MKKSYPQVPNVFQSAPLPPPPKEGGLDEWVQTPGLVDACLRVQVGRCEGEVFNPDLFNV